LKRSRLAGKRVLVTGGAGFIGSHLCDLIIKANPAKLVVVDDFSLGKDRNIRQLEGNQNFKVYRRDATKQETMEGILRSERPHVVFNLAVIPLPMSLEFPKETIEINIMITAALCELLRKGMFETLVHCSSSEAYGTALYVPMDENHPEKPLTPYAASKIACDNIAVSYCKTFGLDIAIARPFNSYGPRQNELSYAGVIPLTIMRIMKGKAPVIFGDGKQTRDYTYVEDTANGIRGVYESKAARGRIVNIASGREVSIRHIIEIIVDEMGYKGEIAMKPARVGDVRRHRGDISLAKRMLGYEPRVGFEEGIRRTIAWYQGI
jgi:UDP-glucose 4-epimerase